MKLLPHPHHWPAAAFASVAVVLSVFVLSGGGGSVPPAPHVPAAVLAVGRIESALAAPPPPPSRPARARHAEATAWSVRLASRVRPATRRTVRQHPRRVGVRLPAGPVFSATPKARVSTPPAPANAAVGKRGKQRGKSVAREKGRRAAEVHQGHRKTEPPGSSGKKHGDGGDHADSGKGYRGGK